MSIIEQAIYALQKAKKIVFFTGAGISADSGIPTYRDEFSGIWAGYDPRDLETAKAFRESSIGVGMVSVAATPSGSSRAKCCASRDTSHG